MTLFIQKLLFDKSVTLTELTVKYLLQVDITLFSHLYRFAKHTQSRESSLHNVMRISRTQRFRQHVCNTSSFEHGTHATTSYHTSTMGSWFYQYLCSAIFSKLVVWYCSIHHGHFYKIL